MYQMDQYTVSLLHFDDGIKDETGKVWTVNGGATVSTGQSKFGKSALYLSAVGDSISIQSPLEDLHSSPYTIEMWFYPTSNTGGIGDQYAVLVGFTGFNDAYTGAAIAYGKVDNDGDKAGEVTGRNIRSVDKVTLNTWNHVALVFDGKNTTLFLNGKLQETLNTLDTTKNLGNLIVGKTAGGYTYQFYGYIDELRISNIARNFTDVSINLSANGGDSQVTLSWNALSDATGYNVKRSTTAGGPYTTIVSNIQGNSYVDTTVTNGTTYYYVITAITPNGESSNSNEASATPEGENLLRITMSDSSEREYEVNTTEFNSFLAWFNRTIGNGSSYYSFNKVLGKQSCTEYLAFDKIISFKTMSVNSQSILKIIMSDSSEREYKVSAADDFVNWHNRTVAPYNTGTTHYEFTDGVDGSKEYLAFDKIISFEVMQLTK